MYIKGGNVNMTLIKSSFSDKYSCICSVKDIGGGVQKNLFCLYLTCVYIYIYFL